GDLFGTKILHQRYGDGASGHETDKISPSSPANVVVLAKGLNPDNGGAHVVYFETGNGGAGFSVGSITYPTALLCAPRTSAMTCNVESRFLEGRSKWRPAASFFGVRRLAAALDCTPPIQSGDQRRTPKKLAAKQIPACRHPAGQRRTEWHRRTA